MSDRYPHRFLVGNHQHGTLRLQPQPVEKAEHTLLVFEERFASTYAGMHGISGDGAVQLFHRLAVEPGTEVVDCRMHGDGYMMITIDDLGCLPRAWQFGYDDTLQCHILQIARCGCTCSIPRSVR